MHSGKKIYGSVSINMPAPFSFVLGGFTLIVILFLIYGLTVDFSAMYLVKGYLNSQLGTTQVYASRPGVISHKFVTAGQSIAKGDQLFLVNMVMDPPSHILEKRLLEERLQRIDRHLKTKNHYLQSLRPLVTKHYVSLASFQSVRDQVTEFETKRHELKMALLRHNQASAYVVRAPINGTISSLEAHVGQQVSLTQSLLTILPKHTKLIAQLYVPVAKSGFLKKGDSIALRYDAYPFQHFGVGKAHIQTISSSILTDREEDKPMQIREPYYKILAYVDHQYILLSGHKHVLRQGMTCTAVMSGNRKKLWRWILDPLYYAGRG